MKIFLGLACALCALSVIIAPSAGLAERDDPPPLTLPVLEDTVEEGAAVRETSDISKTAQLRYLRLVEAIIIFYKRYPATARAHRLGGKGSVFFALDQAGDIVAKSLHRSTGSALLDKEMLEMFDRIGQFPNPPDEIETFPIKIVVPIEYRPSSN
ncbi:MAG: TonB family protein [Pseudomonadota bacterium]